MYITKSNVTQQIIEYIKVNIENGNWKVGESIPSEKKLTELLGVSRASVRAAIQHFIAIGALESLHGKGSFVKTNNLSALNNRLNEITPEDCRDLYKVLEFRRILETEACYLAAQNAGEDTITALKKHLNNMKQNVENAEEFVKEDILFHQEICKAADNHLLEKTLREIFEQTAKSHKQLNEVFGYQDGIYYHTVILKAIKNKKAKQARKMMYEHLQHAMDSLQ